MNKAIRNSAREHFWSGNAKPECYIFIYYLTDDNYLYVLNIFTKRAILKQVINIMQKKNMSGK